MEICNHLKVLELAEKHSILNPEKWLCSMCGTTESVWACLSCCNVACGRFNNEHALNHFNDKKHPLAIEVNERYVYCYQCDEYIYGDNDTKDLTLLREALSAITTQSFDKVESRGQRLLRSYSHSETISRKESDQNDKFVTAVLHHSRSLLCKVFTAWQVLSQQQKLQEEGESTPKRLKTDIPVTPPSGRKRTLIPGVTGLRNLGNTCYMNSILQCLGHLDELREFILDIDFSGVWSPTATPSPNNKITSKSSHRIQRLNTTDYFQHLVKPVKNSTEKKGGLSGGCSPSTSSTINLQSSGNLSNMCLWQEFHGLLRVLWSGKWAQVSPHAFLHTVWNRIPVFKGHSQHDAQEFLCELLDKLEDEVPLLPEYSHHCNILAETFQGQLVSRVTCLKCDHQSSTYEPFLDLSLEFPDRYQITSSNCSISNSSCHLTEMLSKFTDIEMLEGSIYLCEACNKSRKASSEHKPSILSEACKQLLINKLPPVLRLHLKRFRWSGRYHREKIGTHVQFDEDLDISPYCSDNISWTSCTYRLSGVVVHHGWGFGSGHYTSYCWSSEAESWLDCNDSKVDFCALGDVQKSQAYILFYTQVTSDISDNSLATPLICESIDNSDLDPQSENSLMVDEEITFNFKNSDSLSCSSSQSQTCSSPQRLKRRRTSL